jgi:hypothetical protein
MSTKARGSQAGAVNAVDQPAKGIGCKLDTDVYQGIATGLIAGRTVADLAEHYGVSPSTVSVLRHRHFEAIPDHKRRLATKLGAVAEAAADRMAEKLANDEVSDRSLPVFAGVSIEKALMLLDQQSVTVVKHISVKEDSIADVLDRLPRANATAVD